MNDRFRRFAAVISQALGTPYAFIAACSVVILWMLLGPVFEYTEEWQLFINTGTTVVTFLMVFLVQATQNRDARAIHAKLDGLVRAAQGVDDQLAGIERGTDEALKRIQECG